MKTVTRTIGEGTLFFTFKNIAMKIIGLLNVTIVIRYLSVYEYGLNDLVLSLIPLFSLFLLPGLSDLVVADVGVEKGKGGSSNVRPMLASFIKMRIVLGVCAWAILFFGSQIISSYYQSNIGFLVKLVSFSFLISPFRDLLMVIFRVQLKYFYQTLLSLLGEFAKLAILIVSTVIFDFGLGGIIAASIFCDLIAVAILAPAARREYVKLPESIGYHSYPWQNWLKAHGRWSVTNNYISALGRNINIWLIKLFLSTEAVGLYSVATGLISHTTSLLSLGEVVTPIIPQYLHQKEKFNRLISKSIKYQVLSFAALSVVAFFLFPPVISWIFPQYVSAIPLFKVMLLSLIPSGASVIFTAVFYALKAQRGLFFANLMKYFVLIVSFFAFVPWMGVMGTAVVYVVTVLYFAVDRYRILTKMYPEFAISIRGLVSFDDVDKEILARVYRKIKAMI